MKKFLLILLFLPMIGLGQGWIKYYSGIPTGENCGYSVMQTFDGGYITTGLAEWSTHDVGAIMKTDHNGDSIWAYELDAMTNSVIETIDSGYCAVGRGGPGELFFLKTDQDGNIVFQNIINSTSVLGTSQQFSGMSVLQKNDGSFIISGSKKDGFPSDYNGFILHADINGDLIEDFTFDRSDDDWINSSAKLSNGSFIFSGVTKNNDEFDVWLIKTDSNLDTIWTKSFGGSDNDFAASVSSTIDNGCIVVGTTQSFGAGEDDIYLLKIDSEGNEEWSKTYGSSDKEYGVSVKQTNDNGYIIAGELYSGDYIWLLKTDQNGDTLWTNIIEPNCDITEDSWAAPGDINLTNDGGYVITGGMCNKGYGQAYVLIKTNSTGATSISDLSFFNPNRKLDKTIDILGRETKSQPNTPLIEIYDDGSVEKKIIIE